jgi:hypothetical protein
MSVTPLHLQVRCPTCHAYTGNPCKVYDKAAKQFKQRAACHSGRVAASQARQRRSKRARAGHNIDHDAAQVRALIDEAIKRTYREPSPLTRTECLLRQARELT